MALTKTTITIGVKSTLEGTSPGIGGSTVKPGYPLSFKDTISLLAGTGADMADKMYAARRQLASGASEDLDLAGSLADALGTTFTLAKLKAIIIKPVAGNTTTITVTRPAMNGVPLFTAASDGLAPIGRTGLFMWVDPDDGIAVTGGTGDLITITNSAGAVANYDVVLIGTSA